MESEAQPQAMQRTTTKVEKRNRTTTVSVDSANNNNNDSNSSKKTVGFVRPITTRSMFKSTEITTVKVTLPSGATCDRSFELHVNDSELGRGSFGKVYLATMQDDKRPVAIKSVHLDRRYANRELEFLLTLSHPNIIKTEFYYFTSEHDGQAALDGNAFLHIAMEFVPESLHAYIHRYRRHGFYVPIFAIKLIAYQLFRALAYVHHKNICHRDVKPNNILFDEQTGVLKLCDLGSMKRLDGSTPSVAYICSRNYRAPELLCGSVKYSCDIDTWAAGCTFAELILQKPFFPGKDSVDQLQHIIAILGSPTAKKNAEFCTEIDIPAVKAELHKPQAPAVNLSTLFPLHIPSDGIQLLSEMLRLIPSHRITMPEAMFSPFFDELRAPDCLLRKDVELPPLFNYTTAELAYLPAKEGSYAPSMDSVESAFQYRRKRMLSSTSSTHSGRNRSQTPPPLMSSPEMSSPETGKDGRIREPPVRRQSSSD